MLEVLYPIAQNNPNSFDQQTSVNAILPVGYPVGTVQVIPFELIIIVVIDPELVVFETAQNKFKLGHQHTEIHPTVFVAGSPDVAFVIVGAVMFTPEIFGFIVIILAVVFPPVPTAQKIPSISDQQTLCNVTLVSPDDIDAVLP